MLRALVFLFPCTLAAYAGGALDIGELQNVQYGIEILSVPVSEDALGSTQDEAAGKEDEAEVITASMINKDGQRYTCSLPSPKKDDPEDGDSPEKPEETDVQNLLLPLKAGPCIYKTKEWWTYEICYGRQIKQYHVENDKPVGELLVLGVHSPGHDTWGPSNRTYQPMTYTNGSRCDLTGNARQTELRFVCNEAATQEFIGDIFEPQSCEYTIVVHTARLCSVPWLRPVQEQEPLQIKCNPVLSSKQLEKYQLFLEKKALAAKKNAQKKRAEAEAALISSKSSGLTEASALNGLLGPGGEGVNGVAGKIFAELGTMLESALTPDNTGGIGQNKFKVIDLRDLTKDQKDPSVGKPENKAEEIEEPEKLVAEDISTTTDAKWNLINSVHKPILDEEYARLVESRNDIWRKIHESKKLVKKYSSQLHDTETFLENEAGDAFRNADTMARLGRQKKTLEKALMQAEAKVQLYEIIAKDVNTQITSRKGHLQSLEQQLWRGRLEVLLEKMKLGHTEFKVQLRDMAEDFMKITGERLLKIDQYFKLAKSLLSYNGNYEGMEELAEYMKHSDDILMKIAEEDAEMLDFDKEVGELDHKKRVKVTKFKDLLKDDVRNEFGNILKEVSEELEIPDGDVDQNDALKAMGETLDQLMGKLTGTEVKIDKVQQKVKNIKEITQDENEINKILDLKRDGKKSVKKELRVDEEGNARGDIPGIHDDEEDADSEAVKTFSAASENELDRLIAEQKYVLDKAEKELDNLEKQMEEMDKKDVESLKVSVTKVTNLGKTNEMSEEDANNIMKKLEGTIKEKLSQLGLSNVGDKPIEIKLITHTMPEGGMDGDMQDPQAQGLFFNILTGNIQGYDDINSQKRAESNYKFAWDEDQLLDIDEKLGEHEDMSSGSEVIDTTATENPFIIESGKSGELDINVEEKEESESKDEL